MRHPLRPARNWPKGPLMQPSGDRPLGSSTETRPLAASGEVRPVRASLAGRRYAFTFTAMSCAKSGSASFRMSPLLSAGRALCAALRARASARPCWRVTAW